MHDANSTEFDPQTLHPVVDILPEQKSVTKKGATMRLGRSRSSSRMTRWPRSCTERGDLGEHRHRYEINPHYIEMIQEKGLRFTGKSPDGKRMEIAELKGHPFFIGAQFHPEFKSRPKRPSPLHLALVRAALEFSQDRRG